ncbi:MAG: TraB/GumN family protein [Methanosarcinales archaeon]|nr:TraB/GumN family protein [Methanosarcinales archaeon]
MTEPTDNPIKINYHITCTDHSIDPGESGELDKLDGLDEPAAEKEVRDEIILIGTAHVSNKSVDEVKEVIARERPDIVAIELCRGRYESLKGGVKDVAVTDILKSGNMTLFLVHSVLAYFQNKIGSEMDVKPGSEMIAAIDASEELNIEIALVDRDINVTLQRFIAKMGFFEKLKMFGALAGAVFGFGKTAEIDINTITEEDVVTQLVSELRQFSPTTASVLIEERDAFIARNLVDLKGRGRVVAIVGAGHRSGITEYLEHPERLPAASTLLEIPKKRFSLGKIAGFTLILLVLAMFAVLLMTAPLDILLVAFAWWFVINGALSGLGTIIARGHPYSVLTAFGVAWLTSLNPLIAAGWFAGAVEAKMRKPVPSDYHSLTKAETFHEMMENNLFRVILVAALANLGSIAGTFIGAYVVLQVSGIDIDTIRAGVMGALGL